MGLIEVVLAAVGALLIAVVIGGLGQQAADEFKAWTPRIVQRLIRRASRRLPEALRDRMEEEWSAHAADVPGEVGKIACALGFFAASCRISRPFPSLRFRLSILLAPPGRDRQVIDNCVAVLAPLMGISKNQAKVFVADNFSLRHVVRLRWAAFLDLRSETSVGWGTEIGKIVAEVLPRPAIVPIPSPSERDDPSH